MININRTDEECLKNVIKYIYKKELNKDKKKSIEAIKKLPIKEIRYMDNQYRIYEARKNWNILKNKFKLF